MATNHHADSGTRDQARTQVTTAMRAGDVAGLDEFVEWMVDHPDECGKPRSTLLNFRSAWRTVRDQLALDPQLTITELDPDELIDRFCENRGAAFRSSATYLNRLRWVTWLYRAWLTGDTDWQAQLPHRRPRVPRRPSHQSTHVMTFPLRPGMTITVELPVDLKPTEAELLGVWLRNHATGRR